MTAPSRHSRLRWVLLPAGVGLGLLLALLVGGLLVPPLALLHRQAGTLETFYGKAIVAFVARLSSGPTPAIPVAASLQDEARQDPQSTPPQLLANAGRNAYTGSCAQCHGAPGDGKGPFGQATFPPAADLTSKDATDKTDAELFWIIKNGLAFTAMPGFGDDYHDADLLALVSYVRSLQAGSAQPAIVPTPTVQQLSFADGHGDAVQRGAAVYFAQGCQQCHGGFGEAPDELGLQDVSSAADVIRQGRPGMPRFRPDKLPDAQLADLVRYLEDGPPS